MAKTKRDVLIARIKVEDWLEREDLQFSSGANGWMIETGTDLRRRWGIREDLVTEVNSSRGLVFLDPDTFDLVRADLCGRELVY